MLATKFLELLQHVRHHHRPVRLVTVLCVRLDSLKGKERSTCNQKGPRKIDYTCSSTHHTVEPELARRDEHAALNTVHDYGAADEPLSVIHCDLSSL